MRIRRQSCTLTRSWLCSVTRNAAPYSSTVCAQRLNIVTEKVLPHKAWNEPPHAHQSALLPISQAKPPIPCRQRRELFISGTSLGWEMHTLSLVCIYIYIQRARSIIIIHLELFGHEPMNLSRAFTLPLTLLWYPPTHEGNIRFFTSYLLMLPTVCCWARSMQRVWHSFSPENLR